MSAKALSSIIIALLINSRVQQQQQCHSIKFGNFDDEPQAPIVSYSFVVGSPIQFPRLVSNSFPCQLAIYRLTLILSLLEQHTYMYLPYISCRSRRMLMHRAQYVNICSTIAIDHQLKETVC